MATAGPVFGNVITAIVTPFNVRGRVDYKSAELLLKHLQPQCDGIVVAGTTGEGPTLTAKEKLNLVAFYKERAKRGFRVLANVGTNNTAESVSLAKSALQAGADGLMVVGPYYNKPNPDGQLAHFSAVAEASDLPVLLYNIPGRTGLRVDHDVIVELAATTTVKAVKDATGDLEGVARLRGQTPSDFCIYSGDDSLTLPMLAVGGCGVVSVASHLIGRKIKEMITLFMAGKVDKARWIHLDHLELMTRIFMDTNPVPIKAALTMLGVIHNNLRLPMTALGSEKTLELELLLREYRLLK